MGIFKGQGTYYKVEGSGERFVFFTNNEKKLLDEDAINSFNENWMGEIANDYDSIYFKKDGEAYWFVDSTVYKQRDHKRSINEV
jgi:hypothetical protein